VRRVVDRLVVLVVPVALIAYTPLALANRWWISGLCAPIVTWLLARRHRRARFSAYVLLSVIVVRSLLHGPWWLALAALAVIAVMQAPAACEAWPRVAPGRRPRRVDVRGGDRMTPP
jgi:hypothetical protein